MIKETLKGSMKDTVIHKNKRPVLREKCQPVTRVTDRERKLFASMIAIMRKNKGIGLTAVQRGILKQMIALDI